jgi:hypothetical protein
VHLRSEIVGVQSARLSQSLDALARRCLRVLINDRSDVSGSFEFCHTVNNS